jgi:hypothetical protein
MARLVATVLAIFLLVSCTPEDAHEPHSSPASAARAKSVPPPPPPPPDVGDIGRFLACSAPPRRQLSPRERCEVQAFRARCTALDDCYVSCISSPGGSFVGGRCAHVCTMGPHQGAPHPAAISQCSTFPGRSGIDVESGPNNSFKPKPLRGSA